MLLDQLNSLRPLAEWAVLVAFMRKLESTKNVLIDGMLGVSISQLSSGLPWLSDQIPVEALGELSDPIV